MSLARKIFSNTAWQVFGKVITAILGIISIKFITNYLSRSAYGEYTTIYDYTALFAIIADFGLFTIAVREMAHNNTKEAVAKIVGNVLSIRTALAIAALGLGILAAFLLPAYHGSNIPVGVAIVSAATIITLMAGTMSSVLQFYLKMHWASIALTVGKIITVGYILLTILYIYPQNPEAGFPHLLLAWIMGGVVTILIIYIASSRLTEISFKWDFSFWKMVLIKALPYGLALVLGTIYFRMGTIVLSLYKMKDAAGSFGVPLRFLEILQIIPHYFMNSVLPVLTIALTQNSERATRILKYALNALAALAFPIFVGGVMLAWPLTAAVSSPEFLTTRAADGTLTAGSDMALKILLVAMLCTYLHVALSYALVAMGKQKELLWINAITVVVNVTLNIVLVPRFTFIGAAVSAVAAEIVMFFILVSRVHVYFKKVWDFWFIAKTGFSSIVMGVALFFTVDPLSKALSSKSLLILIPLGGVVFGASMLATKAVSKEMIALLKRAEPPPATD